MYIYDDGGKCGVKGKSDCGVRAVAIALDMPYQQARKLLKEQAAKGRQGNKAISKGIYKEDLQSAIESFGWYWVSAPKFTGRKARYTDLPSEGNYIVSMAKHFTAVVDGQIRDTWDCSNKMVYGYWAKSN